MNGNKQKQFKKFVLTQYKTNGRTHLPWRTRPTPYRVFVSEYMLQQTQVERVIPKFNAFVRKFPNFKTLSKASLVDVFALWQGLGYNRRAKYLRDSAVRIIKERKGILSNDAHYLQSLPGIGPYTAGAIRAFAFGESEPFIETNIRTVILHHFFKNKKEVPDKDILQVLKRYTPKRGKDAKKWYSALMDYGSYLKQSGLKLNPKSSHYIKQSIFRGSRRELRGKLLKTLLQKPETISNLSKSVGESPDTVAQEVARLCKEKLVISRGKSFFIAN